MAPPHRPVRSWRTLYVVPAGCGCGGRTWPCPAEGNTLGWIFEGDRLRAEVLSTDLPGAVLPEDVLYLRAADWYPSYGLALFITGVEVVRDDPGYYDHGVFVQVTGRDLAGRSRTVYVREDVLLRAARRQIAR